MKRQPDATDWASSRAGWLNTAQYFCTTKKGQLGLTEMYLETELD